jgi:hypothetical protein
MPVIKLYRFPVAYLPVIFGGVGFNIAYILRIGTLGKHRNSKPQRPVLSFNFVSILEFTFFVLHIIKENE